MMNWLGLRATYLAQLPVSELFFRVHFRVLQMCGLELMRL